MSFNFKRRTNSTLCTEKFGGRIDYKIGEGIAMPILLDIRKILVLKMPLNIFISKSISPVKIRELTKFVFERI